MRYTASIFPGKPAIGIIFFLLLLLVFGLPLLVLPGMVDSFILPKFAVLQAMAVLMLGGAALAAFTGVPLRLPLEPVNLAILVYILWSGISIFWAEAPDLAIQEFGRLLCLLVVAFMAQILVEGYRVRLLRLIQAFLISTVIVAILVILQDFRQAFFPTTIAVRSILGDWRDAIGVIALGNTSHLGDLLTAGFLGWFGVLILARQRVFKFIAMKALWLHGAALIVCWSVHSNLALVIAMLLFVYTLREQLMDSVRRRLPMWGLLVFGWVIVVAFYVVDHPVNPHGSAVWGPNSAKSELASGGIFSQAFASDRWTSGLDTRMAIWLTSLEMLRNNPWLGSGAGTFTWVYPGTVSPILRDHPTLHVYAGSWTNAAHNEILQTWSEVGIIGVFLLIVMVALSLRATIMRLKVFPSHGSEVILVAGACMLVAFCLQSQMNFPLRLPVSLVIFFLLLVLPHLVPRSAAEPYALDVPVERDIGPVLIGVTMRNMAYPSSFSFRMDLPGMPGKVVGGILAAIAFVGAVLLLAPVRSDMLYREARNARDLYRGGILSSPHLFQEKAEAALAVWAGHVDCRSAMQDLYAQSGSYERAISETPLVLRRLNATEVYYRRAISLEALGRAAEAEADWDEIFRRRPEYGSSHPRQYEAWLRRQPEIPQGM